MLQHVGSIFLQIKDLYFGPVQITQLVRCFVTPLCPVGWCEHWCYSAMITVTVIAAHVQLCYWPCIPHMADDNGANTADRFSVNLPQCHLAL